MEFPQSMPDFSIEFLNGLKNLNNYYFLNIFFLSTLTHINISNIYNISMIEYDIVIL